MYASKKAIFAAFLIFQGCATSLATSQIQPRHYRVNVPQSPPPVSIESGADFANFMLELGELVRSCDPSVNTLVIQNEVYVMWLCERDFRASVSEIYSDSTWVEITEEQYDIETEAIQIVD